MFRSTCALWSKLMFARGQLQPGHRVAVARLVALVAVPALARGVGPGFHGLEVLVVGPVAGVALLGAGQERVLRARAAVRRGVTGLAGGADLGADVQVVVEAKRQLLGGVDDEAGPIVRIFRPRRQQLVRHLLVRRQRREAMDHGRRLGHGHRDDRQHDQEGQQGEQAAGGTGAFHLPTASDSMSISRTRWPTSRFMSCSNSNAVWHRGANR